MPLFCRLSYKVKQIHINKIVLFHETMVKNDPFLTLTTTSSSTTEFTLISAVSATCAGRCGRLSSQLIGKCQHAAFLLAGMGAGSGRVRGAMTPPPNFADTYRKENISRYRNRQYVSSVPSHFWTLPPPLIQLFYLPLLFSSWVCSEIFRIVILVRKHNVNFIKSFWL